LRKEKYASKISAQETQQLQENHASKKQNYATDASGPCARKHNDRIDFIFHATQLTQALALRAFEWNRALDSTPSTGLLWTAH